jgi:hypothetical protein
VGEGDGTTFIKQFFKTINEMQDIHTILRLNSMISDAIFGPDPYLVS